MVQKTGNVNRKGGSFSKKGASTCSAPIYIIIGTRGQFTKMAPVIQEMENQGIAFTLINTGQHTISSVQIATLFGIRSGDQFLTRRDKDIEKIGQALRWFCSGLFALIAGGKRIFSKGRGIAIIHGDTMSTLLALIGSRLWGMKVVHIESGLRSGSFFHPFPEEIIRVLACRLSHYLFAPSETAYDNLFGYRAFKYDTGGNTVFDAVRYVQSLGGDTSFGFPYCVVTIHRSEVLYRENLFRTALSAVYKASQFIKVVFVTHRATLLRLQAIGELANIQENQNIILKDYYDYASFMALIKSAQFVMTDGGGLQEETFLLNVPCLILRKRTERKFGIGTTTLLSELKPEKIEYFLKNYQNFRRNELEYTYPSKLIVQKLLELR